MKILILGGAGMVGRKLAERLAADGQLGGKEISELTLYDVVAAQKPAGALFPVNIVSAICRRRARRTSSLPASRM